MAKAKKEKKQAEQSFEAKLWEAANKLRDTLDASEYKTVILGLIFLKYISDRCEARQAEIEAEGGDISEPDEYLAENVCIVPEKARWPYVASYANKEEIGQVIDEAMLAIENANDKFRGKNILPKNFARHELDKVRLGEVVRIFDNLPLHDPKQERDILGRAYEYCLAKFAEGEAQKAGQFYTPACIVRTIVEILQPYSGRVYDPCCGSGGMFVQSAKFIEKHGGQSDDISIYGQESNLNTYKMAHMNLAIRGLEANIQCGNTFTDDKHAAREAKDGQNGKEALKFDFIMANPPFNMDDWHADKLKDDVRFKTYGTPPEGNANFAWFEHMIYHLSDKGRLGCVMANGSLSSQESGEGEIRRNIIKADLVEAIIALPAKLFYTTQIPACLWFLAKDKKQKGKTLFIDARQLGRVVTRKLSELTEADIEKMAATYNAFAEGKLENEAGFCAVVSTEDIAKQDYILTPGRYVGIAEQEDDGEPFAEKMARLTKELSSLFAQSHQLEAEIKEKLGAIGYEI